MIEPNILFLITAVVVILLTIGLILFRRHLNKKDNAPKRNSPYQDELRRIKITKTSIKDNLAQIDEIGRGFFSEYLNIPKGTEYAEIINVAKQQNKPEVEIFCSKMIEFLYSGEIPDERSMNLLLSILENTISIGERKMIKENIKKKLKENEKFLILHKYGDSKEIVNKFSSDVLNSRRREIKSTHQTNFKKEKIKLEKSNGKTDEKHHHRVHSIDVLDRIKAKMKK